MSQAQLGRVMEICRQAVNRIENRRVMPHYTTLEKFRNLEVRHEQARALTRAMAVEFRIRRRNSTKGDMNFTLSPHSALQSESALEGFIPQHKR